MVWSTRIYTCTHQHMVTQSSQGWHPEDCFPRLSVTCLKIQWLLQLYCSWTLWWFWNFYTSSRLKAFLIYLGSPPVFFSTLLKFPLLDVFYTLMSVCTHVHAHTHTHTQPLPLPLGSFQWSNSQGPVIDLLLFSCCVLILGNFISWHIASPFTSTLMIPKLTSP